KDKYNVAAAHLRLLIAELGLRCYRNDQGSAPQRLQELVPKYLQRVPNDPFTGNPLVYRSQGSNWVLYSICPDLVDDKGEPAGCIISGDQLIGVRVGSGPRRKGDLFYGSGW